MRILKVCLFSFIFLSVIFGGIFSVRSYAQNLFQTGYLVKQPKKKKLDLGLSGLSTREKMEAIAGQMSALADELTTERELKHGGREDDPAAKPFTKLPEPAYIASGAALTGGLTAAAHKLKESHNKLLRVIGNVAQDVQIGVNAGNAVRNSQEPIRRPK